MRSALSILTLLSSVVIAPTALAVSPGDVVENFVLFDHRGERHELYEASGAKAVVLMVHGNGCPIVRQVLPDLMSIRERYGNRAVEFLLLDSNLQDSPEDVASEAEAFGIAFPVLVDREQRVGESLDVQRTAEVFLIDPSTWTLIYRGPVDDRVSYERQRPAAERAYLQDALDALLAGATVPWDEVPAEGCLVHFPERQRRRERVAQHLQRVKGWPMSELKIQRERMEGGVITFLVTRAGRYTAGAGEGATSESDADRVGDGGRVDVRVRVEAQTGQILSITDAFAP